MAIFDVPKRFSRQWVQRKVPQMDSTEFHAMFHEAATRGWDEEKAVAVKRSIFTRVTHRYVRTPILRTLVMAQQPGLQGDLAQEAARLRHDLAPGNPAANGFKCYSQNDEDGILEEIFRRVGEQDRTFVEFGCGNGLENNSHLLLLKGWRGAWIDGDPSNIAFIASHVPLASKRLNVSESFIMRENAVDLVSRGLAGVDATLQGLDLLSVDIDGNDLAVLCALLSVSSPRVICVEYNAKFPPSVDVEMPYNATHSWAVDDYQGASLSCLARRLSPGYALVGCSVSGVNAFFVRRALAAEFPTTSVEDLYQPARYRLALISSGHPASLKFLASSLATDQASWIPRLGWGVDALRSGPSYGTHGRGHDDLEPRLGDRTYRPLRSRRTGRRSGARPCVRARRAAVSPRQIRPGGVPVDRRCVKAAQSCVSGANVALEWQPERAP
jgi:hypothetical protein